MVNGIPWLTLLKTQLNVGVLEANAFESQWLWVCQEVTDSVELVTETFSSSTRIYHILSLASVSPLVKWEGSKPETIYPFIPPLICPWIPWPSLHTLTNSSIHVFVHLPLMRNPFIYLTRVHLLRQKCIHFFPQVPIYFLLLFVISSAPQCLKLFVLNFFSFSLLCKQDIVLN